MKRTIQHILQRIGELDRLLVLRGIAALAVVVYHTQNYLRPNLNNNVDFLGLDLTWLFTPEGKMPVVIFFTLSGYLMFKAFIAKRYELNKHGITKFYKSRARRILPLYYFLAFLFLILITPQLFLSPEGLGTIRDVLLFNYNGTGEFIAPFWSLSVEVKFYILTPILAFLVLRYLKTTTLRIIGLSAIVLSIIIIRLTVGEAAVGLNSAMSQFITALDAFFIGGFTVFAVDRYKNSLWFKKRKNTLLIASIILGLSLIPLSSLYFFKFYSLGFEQIGTTVIALLTAIFIFMTELSVQKSHVKRHYSFRQLWQHPWLLPEFIGALSFGIYLWHSPIIDRSFIIPVSNAASVKESLLRATVVIIVSTILSYITYKYIESHRPHPRTVDEPPKSS
jgi:peptidoglycan/LPS O-acetylase OafA/YrhL